ncbi:MAG: hypothetical protein JW830_10195 [Bacteroidales bacterium]|nr:hypothetical protein [Bacteroidales bacterium]
MKNKNQLLGGLIITVLIFFSAVFIGNQLHLKAGFIPDSFITQTVMIILSLAVICRLREIVNYRISLPSLCLLTYDEHKNQYDDKRI